MPLTPCRDYMPFSPLPLCRHTPMPLFIATFFTPTLMPFADAFAACHYFFFSAIAAHFSPLPLFSPLSPFSSPCRHFRFSLIFLRHISLATLPAAITPFHLPLFSLMAFISTLYFFITPHRYFRLLFDTAFRRLHITLFCAARCRRAVGHISMSGARILQPAMPSLMTPRPTSSAPQKCTQAQEARDARSDARVECH